jgi:hypothetical protein
MLRTVIAERPIGSADEDPDSNLDAVPVQDDRAHFPPAEPARPVRAPEHGPVAERGRGRPLDHPAERELVLVPVAEALARGRPLDRAAADRIALAVIAHRAAEAAARLAEEAETSLAPAVAEVVIAWAAEDLVEVAVVAVEVAADVAVEADEVAGEGEQINDE